MHERKLLHKLLEGLSAISHIKRQESEERQAIYQTTLNYLTQPLMMMLMDWSEVEHHGCHTLRASLYLKDRSITVYEELHAEKWLGNSAIQKQFLRRLKEMLPEETQVILIADENPQA